MKSSVSAMIPSKDTFDSEAVSLGAYLTSISIWTAFLAAGADNSGLLGPNELRESDCAITHLTLS